MVVVVSLVVVGLRHRLGLAGCTRVLSLHISGTLAGTPSLVTLVLETLLRRPIRVCSEPLRVLTTMALRALRLGMIVLH